MDAHHPEDCWWDRGRQWEAVALPNHFVEVLVPLGFFEALQWLSLVTTAEPGATPGQEGCPLVTQVALLTVLHLASGLLTSGTGGSMGQVGRKAWRKRF